MGLCGKTRVISPLVAGSNPALDTTMDLHNCMRTNSYTCIYQQCYVLAEKKRRVEDNCAYGTYSTATKFNVKLRGSSNCPKPVGAAR